MRFHWHLVSCVAVLLTISSGGQALPPPVTGGALQIEADEAGQSVSVQPEYLPPRAGLPLGFLGQVISQRREAPAVRTFVPGTFTATFTVAETYQNPQLGFYKTITFTRRNPAPGQENFALEAERADSTFSLSGPGGVYKAMFQRRPGGGWPWRSTSFWDEPRFRLTASDTMFYLFWNASSRVYFLPGIADYWTEEHDGATQAFHLSVGTWSAEEQRYIYHPIGTVEHTGSAGGYKTEVTPLTPAGAYTALKNGPWIFTGDFVPLSDPGAHYAFTPEAASASKLAYKMTNPTGTAWLIAWWETFTPAGAAEPSDYRFMVWQAAADATESPVYYLDPFEEGNPHRFGAQPGQYHLVPYPLELAAQLAVDLNRDGAIKPVSQDPSDQASAEYPFRFWINDDNDQNAAEGDDIPGQDTNSANYNSAVVDSIRDLVDFFPVYLDIKPLLTVLPPDDSIKYKLKQADGALNFVYTDLTRDRALACQKELLTTGFGDQFDQAPGNAVTHQITIEGYELSSSFLNGVKDNDWGVVLVEGRATTTAPLVLAVEKEGMTIAELSLPLRISPVEGMFRHLNLRSLAKNYDESANVPSDVGPATRIDDPGDPLPDTATNGKYFVFVHGYNVDAEQARGWQAEVFKRLHQLGSHARFVGVSWYGSTGLDYHKAVFHAFQTGDLLQEQLGLSAGTDVTVAAHSLGNMVVSQAIQYGGFAPSRYYMINAAVPLEAYDLGSVTNDQRTAMTEHKWKSLEPALFAANWHQLFTTLPSPPNPAGTSDHRSELKWKERFKDVLSSVSVENFYSPGDDVVENPKWDNPSILGIILQNGFNLSRGAWVTQEFAKGANVIESAGVIFFSRVQGGWGLSLYYGPPNNPSLDLTHEPYFGYFLEEDLFSANPAAASTKAEQKFVQYDLLARGIPALSYATASNPFLRQGIRNFDMESDGREANTWPTEGHSGASDGQWLHSDFKDVALTYVNKMYCEMIINGSLQ
ncbi:MAG: hypothetical protein PHE83_00670 [Opitutaceae bacterium]|nr:hypothetical protein [Opitutaceae bacterium]